MTGLFLFKDLPVFLLFFIVICLIFGSLMCYLKNTLFFFYTAAVRNLVFAHMTTDHIVILLEDCVLFQFFFFFAIRSSRCIFISFFAIEKIGNLLFRSHELKLISRKYFTFFYWKYLSILLNLWEPNGIYVFV